MSSQPSWRPNLPESQLFGEKTWLQGAILEGVAYGVNLTLFILIMSLLFTRLKGDIKHKGRPSRKTACLLTYVCMMFILSTLAIASRAEMAQLSFIENRNFPGGPGAYQGSMMSIPISRLGNYCLVLMNWFSDSLLLWRCSVIYGLSRTSVWLVMAVPGLVLLASFVAGTIFLESITRPSSLLMLPSTAFELIYGTVTISLNIILTLMIVIRLYLYRRRFARLFGPRHGAHYTSIISMLIESAAVLVILALWLLIPLAMGNPLANIPVFSVIQVQAAASYMIIFRVAQGTAWTSRTASESQHRGTVSNIRFQTASVNHPTDRRDVLDTESNNRDSVHESSPRVPGVIEQATN